MSRVPVSSRDRGPGQTLTRFCVHSAPRATDRIRLHLVQ